MKFSEQERRFLTALLREQNQSGCRGPAHDILRKHAYSDAPMAGPGSLAFAYEVVPLTTLLVADFTDLEKLDEFVRKAEKVPDVNWPWSSTEEFRARLDAAREEWTRRRENSDQRRNGDSATPPAVSPTTHST